MVFMRILVTALLLSISGCSNQPALQDSEYRIQSGRDLKIFTTTDLHYLSKKLNDGGTAFNRTLANGDGKQLRYSEEMMQAFITDVTIQRPDILIISGDLTNNGERQSHLDMARHLAVMESSTGTRVYVIPGNHDLLNPWAREFKGARAYRTESITPKDFQSIYEPFGYNEAISRDSKSLSYLAAPSDKLWLLMLDTSQYRNNKALRHPQLEGRVTSSTLKWIDKCGKLAAKSGARIVAVMHHSLVDHNEFIEKGFTLNDNQKLIHVLQRNHVPVVFSGHIHIQNISSAGQDSGVIYDISNNALSVYPHQFGILNYSEATHALDYSISPLKMELWALSQKVANPNLRHFDTYSEEFFKQISLNRSYKDMRRNNSFNSYTEKQLHDMAAVVHDIHKDYFSGYNRAGLQALSTSEGYRLWLEAPPSFLRTYVLRMSSQHPKDHHHLHVQLQSLP